MVVKNSPKTPQHNPKSSTKFFQIRRVHVFPWVIVLILQKVKIYFTIVVFLLVLCGF